MFKVALAIAAAATVAPWALGMFELLSAVGQTLAIVAGVQ